MGEALTNGGSARSAADRTRAPSLEFAWRATSTHLVADPPAGDTQRRVQLPFTDDALQERADAGLGLVESHARLHCVCPPPLRRAADVSHGRPRRRAGRRQRHSAPELRRRRESRRRASQSQAGRGVRGSCTTGVGVGKEESGVRGRPPAVWLVAVV